MPSDKTPRRDQAERLALVEGLGGRLRKARESQGMGLRELSRRVGVSPSLISQIETGKSVPSVSTLFVIAGELNLPANEIVFGGTMGPASPAGSNSSHTSDEELRVKAPATIRADAERLASVGDGSASPVQRSHARRVIHLDTGVVWERLTAASDHDGDFLYVRYPPGAASADVSGLVRHNGREYGYVLSGRLLVSIGFDDYELSAGDSVSFDSTEPHRLAAIGDEPAEAIWFVLGRRRATPN